MPGNERNKDEANAKGWTIPSLMAHYEHLMEERDKRYAQRFECQEGGVKKAHEDLNRRLEEMNKFREQLREQAATFLARRDYEMAHSSLIEKIDRSIAEVAKKVDYNTGRIDRIEAKGQGLSAGWAYLVAAVGVAATIVTVGYLIFTKSHAQ